MTITAIKSNKETKRENRLRYNMTRKSRKKLKELVKLEETEKQIGVKI